MISGRKMVFQVGDCLHVAENQFYILVEGCLVKRSDNQSGFGYQGIKRKRATIRNSRSKDIAHVRVSRKMSFMHNITNQKKPIYKKIQSNSSKPPLLIPHQSQDKKPYECKKHCILFHFYQTYLNKFIYWLSIKQKQGLITFISGCFGVSDQKCLSKITQNIVKLRFTNKHRINIQQRTVYMIYLGQIEVTTNQYKVILNKNSIIYYDNKCSKIQIQFKSQQILLISIPLSTIIQLLQQSFPNTLSQIQTKLNSLHTQRSNSIKTIFLQIPQQQQLQPIFNENQLNLKSFQKQRNKYNLSFNQSQSSQLSSSFFNKSKTNNRSSRRWRVKNNLPKDNVITSDLSIFMSNYPYDQIIKSKIRVSQIQKRSSEQNPIKKPQNQIISPQSPSQRRLQKTISWIQKLKKIKIRNIIQKQIPIYKQFINIQSAQKQISNNLLFHNFITYPINEITHHTKQFIKNNIKQIINVRNQSKINKISHKYINQIRRNQYQISQNLSNIFSMQSQRFCNQSINGNQNVEKSHRNTVCRDQQYHYGTFDKGFKTVSNLFGNNFCRPCLPTQKQIKSKVYKTNHNFESKSKGELSMQVQVTRISKPCNQKQNKQRTTCITNESRQSDSLCRWSLNNVDNIID